MTLIYIFFAGFIASFGGTILPGLLNLTAGKIAMEHNTQSVNLYIAGACSITTLYSFIATQFSFYITAHPDFVQNIYKIGALIFSVLTIYFFWKDYSLQNNPNSDTLKRKNYFITGIFLSCLNILPLPFYTGISILLSKNDILSFYINEMIVLIASIVIGTAIALKLYSIYVPKIAMLQNRKPQDKRSNRNNRILGIITAIIAIISIYQIF